MRNVRWWGVAILALLLVVGIGGRVSALDDMSGSSPLGGRYAYRIDIKYDDETTDRVLLKFDFSDTWSVQEHEFVLPKKSKRIMFRLVFANQTSEAWFDSVEARFDAP